MHVKLWGGGKYLLLLIFANKFLKLSLARKIQGHIQKRAFQTVQNSSYKRHMILSNARWASEVHGSGTIKFSLWKGPSGMVGREGVVVRPGTQRLNN